MPTNFHISPRPALRCVPGEPYLQHAPDLAAGFFTRLRVAERLIIASGPHQTVALAPQAWVGSRAQLDNLRVGFPKKYFHA